MGRRLSIFWGLLIILVILLLWGREAYLYIHSTSNDNSTTNSNSTADKEIVSNWLNPKLSLGVQEEPTMNEFEIFKTMEGENVDIYFKKTNQTFHIDGKKSRRIRGSGSEGGKKKVAKIPHAAFQPHTKEEFDDVPLAAIKIKTPELTPPPKAVLEFRAGLAGNSSNSSNTTSEPFTDDKGGFNVPPDVLRKGCVDIPKPLPVSPGKLVGPPQPEPNPIYPPCPFEDPSTEEPIPLIRYRGRLEWNQPCIMDDDIAEIQLKGQSKFPPLTAPPVDDIEKGLVDKGAEIESKTCNQRNGLECFEIPLASGTGVEHRCRCMAAFGQVTSNRLQIGGKCYIPADKGHFSDCFENQAGFPLPTGDTVWNPREFNPVFLPCVPNAVCRENSLWFGKRCSCKKGTILQSDGTCDKGRSLLPWKFLIFICAIFQFDL